MNENSYDDDVDLINYSYYKIKLIFVIYFKLFIATKLKTKKNIKEALNRQKESKMK